MSAAVRHRHGKTTTLVAGLSLEGLPMILDGAMNGPAFKASIEQLLAPSLGPDDIVVPKVSRRDNLPAHRVAGVREAIEARGARKLFLPPHSPAFTPIELAFAKLKALLRKAAAHTLDALGEAIAHAIEAFTPSKRANDFTTTGYEPE